MPWISVSMECDAESVDPFSDALIDAGAIAVDVSDKAAGTVEEQPLFGEQCKPGEHGWKRVIVKVLFPRDTDVPSSLMQACRVAEIEACGYQLEVSVL